MEETSTVIAAFPERAVAVPAKRYRAAIRQMHRYAMAVAGAGILGSFTGPAMAAAPPEPSTRLIRCGDESCLQIRGRRDDPAMIVRVNGHVVPVNGEHRWRTHLPVEVVRQWSESRAQTIEVSLHHPDTKGATMARVDLPIGMLGSITDLSSIVISAF